MSELLDHFAPGARVAVADGPAGARDVPAMLAASGRLGDVELLLGFTPETAPWLDEVRGARTVMGGYALTQAVDAGRMLAPPVRLASVPRLLAGPLRPDVAVVSARPAGRGWIFGTSVGWAPAAARHARAVVVEVNAAFAPVDAPPVEGSVVATIETDRPPHVPARVEPGEVELQIGARVAELVPHDATIQFGPGAINDAMVRALDTPVRVASGLATDALVSLDAAGLLVGQASAAYLWGSDELTALALDGKVRLVPVEESHDLGRLAATPRFIALNTALQVGLDGSVNIERVGGRQVAGIGGHADFCIAGALSEGGASIIALRSSVRGRSAIVPRVSPVSTSRADVDFVVTEHGLADLGGADDRERAQRIISVADPEARHDLGAALRDGAGVS